MARICPDINKLKPLIDKYGKQNAYKFFYKNNSKIPTEEEISQIKRQDSKILTKFVFEGVELTTEEQAELFGGLKFYFIKNLINNFSEVDDFSNLLEDVTTAGKFQQVYQDALLDMINFLDDTDERAMEIAMAISDDFPTSLLADDLNIYHEGDHANLILDQFKTEIANLIKFVENDDNSFEPESTSEETKDMWNKESIEQNRKDSFSRAIKLLISGIPKLNKETLVPGQEYSLESSKNLLLSNNLKLEQPIDQSEANNLLLNTFVNLPADINAFMRVIHNERKTNPTIEWIYQKVFNPNQFIFDDKGNILSLKDNSEANLPRVTLINKFISSFSNTKYQFMNQVISGDEIKSQNADTNNMKNRMLKEWSGNLDILFSENKSKITNTINDKYASTQDILKAVGFPLASEAVINSKKKLNVLGGSKTFFETYAAFLDEFTDFIKKGNPKDIFEQIGREPSKINTLATAMVEFNVPYRNDYDNQHYNVEGNRVSSINFNTYQTLTINNLNRVVDLVRDELGYDVEGEVFRETYLKRLNELYPEVLNSWSYDSVWLNKYLARGNKLTMQLLGGTTKDSDGTPTSKLVESDLWSSFLNNTLENNFPAIKHADRGMFPAYSFGYGVTDIFSDIPGNFTPTSNWRNIFKGYLHDYFISELKRVRKNRGTYKSFIENYDRLGQEFLIFSGVLDIFKEDAGHQARLESLINSDKLDYTNDSFVNKQLDSWIDNYFTKTKAESKLTGINELKPGDGLNKTVIKSLSDAFKSKPDTFEFYDEAIELAAAKFFIGAVEQSKLFLGDPAFYKIKGFEKNLDRVRELTSDKKSSVPAEQVLIYDIIKRANMQSSTKQVMIVDNVTNTFLDSLFNSPEYKIKLGDGEEFYYKKKFDGTLTELVIDDPATITHIKTELEKIYANDPESLKAYTKGFEESDGYSIGNIFFAAESIFRTEGITSSRLEVVKRELKALQAKSKEDMYGLYEIPEEYDTPEKIDNYMKNVIRPFTQQKYQYVGPNYMMDREEYSKEDPSTRLGVIAKRKNSYGMLIPSLIKGTILEDLNIFMLKNGIDTIHFASASKVGAPIRPSNSRRKFYKPLLENNKTIGFDGFNNETIQAGDKGILDFRYLGKQNEIAFEIKKKVTDSTQSRKNILSGIMVDGEIPVDFKGTTEEWNALDAVDKIKQSKLWSNFLEYEDTYAELVYELTDELLKEYNSTESTGSLSINDGAKFANLIRKSAVERGSPNNILDAITDWVDAKGGLKYIESLSNYPKIQYILTSLVTNNLLILKRNGTMLAQAPSTGWETGNREFSNGKAVAGAFLKFYEFTRDKDGNIIEVHPAECALPFPIEKLPGLFKKYKTKDIIKAIDLLNADIERGFIPPIIVKALRIPNQQLSSNDVLQVKKFLYPMYTQTVIVPNEIIVKTGGDFDIDKESIFLPFLDDNFNTKSPNELEGTKKLQARLLEIEIEMLLNPARIDRFLKPVVGGELQNLAQLEQKKTLGTSNSVNTPFTDIFKIGSLVKSTLEYVGGKQGVGVVATWITFHKIMEMYNKSLADGTKFSVTNIEVNGKLQEVEDVLSSLITSQVDIVKDSYSSVVNIVLDTLNPVCFMVLEGRSTQEIIDLVNSPVIREYYKLLNKSKAKSISVERGLKTKKGITEYLLKTYPQEQLKLYEWVALEEKANKITDVKSELSADTKYLKSPSEVQALETLYKTITSEEGILSKETIDDLMNNSILTPFIESRALISKWFDQLYLTKSNERMRNITEDLRDKAFGHIRNKETNNKARQRFDENLINYLIQTNENSKEFIDKFDEYFKGDNSLAKRILRAKKNPAFKNNYLINQLVAQLDNKLGINENEKIDNLKLYAGQLKPAEANSLAQAFEDIKKIDESLYNDLVIFNIFQSGISNGTYQLNKVIPYQAQKQVLDFIATMDVNSITNKVLADFYVKFFLANPTQINKRPKPDNIFSPFKKDYSSGKLAILTNELQSENVETIGGVNGIDYTKPLPKEAVAKAMLIEKYLDDYNTRKAMERIGGEKSSQPIVEVEEDSEKQPLNNDIIFAEDLNTGYAERTRRNASADATIAIAVDFTSAGEKLTKTSVLNQNKKYIPINANTLTVTKERVDKIVEALNSINKSDVKNAASIPQNLVSGVEAFGTKQEANSEAKNLLGNSPHSIDMIEAGIRTRTTRSVGEMEKYNIKVGDTVTQFGKSADGSTKQILTRITAIHPKGTPGFLGTWNKEGWAQEGIKAIERFKDGAAAIEFEIIKPSITLNIAGNGIYTMKGKYTQQQVDDFTYELLKAVINSSNLKNKIISIRTGGQTGFDEAGAKAGIKLGIKTYVLAPKGWKFRNIAGQDISNEEQFKSRFNTPDSKSSILDQDTNHFKC